MLKSRQSNSYSKQCSKFINVYELDRWSLDLNDKFAQKQCLFGAVKLTKNPSLDKYFCLGYAIGFDSQSFFFSSEV